MCVIQRTVSPGNLFLFWRSEQPPNLQWREPRAKAARTSMNHRRRIILARRSGAAFTDRGMRHDRGGIRSGRNDRPRLPQSPAHNRPDQRRKGMAPVERVGKYSNTRLPHVTDYRGVLWNKVPDRSVTIGPSTLGAKRLIRLIRRISSKFPQQRMETECCICASANPRIFTF
ncbi:Hypothetical protein NTJ_00977 [Nesidiocoris tenuis]|uniref:Uncharacterized protein n=1 Tax=Nesidiocoris tenuis TaxID=355587 RepID=A0ABN7ABE9_9HEMI|nr:Hypothetical protein NTJ_00977 [Nesidiocoris tenuis]